MSLTADLREFLGPDKVTDQTLELLVYGKDAGIRPGRPLVVALPTGPEEVAGIVRIARRHGVAIVPRGAGTGLAGGAVPSGPAVLIVLTRLDRIHEVDPVGRTAWVGPGVLNLDLTRRVADHGLHFAPDPSSQAACTIGGNIANNSGGPHTLAEGSTTSHVLAVEFVTADGEVLVAGGAAPDPPGLDLRALLVGSEGTLGIITRALVRLTPDPPAVRTLLAGFERPDQAVSTVSAIVAAGVVPAALEVMDRPMTECVERFVHAGYPVDAGAVLLAEVAGHPAAVDAQATLIADLARREDATTVRVASDSAERALLWKGRKSAFGAVAQVAPNYYLHDVVVPRDRLVGVMEEVYRIAARHRLIVMNVFHAGDGNLHPLILYDASEPGIKEAVTNAAREIVEVSVAAGGMLSGEHGIGAEKRDLMPLVFGPADLAAQVCVRDAFGGSGFFNPDKVLPAGPGCFDRSGP